MSLYLFLYMICGAGSAAGLADNMRLDRNTLREPISHLDLDPVRMRPFMQMFDTNIPLQQQLLGVVLPHLLCEVFRAILVNFLKMSLLLFVDGAGTTPIPIK